MRDPQGEDDDLAARNAILYKETLVDCLVKTSIAMKESGEMKTNGFIRDEKDQYWKKCKCWILKMKMILDICIASSFNDVRYASDDETLMQVIKNIL